MNDQQPPLHHGVITPAIQAAAASAAGDLSDDDLVDALFWLVRETSHAISPTGIGLLMAGTPLTAGHTDYLRALWFHTHLLGVIELAQEYHRRHPNLVAETADWRTAVAQSFEQGV